MDKRLDEELHLVHVGLSRVAEENIMDMQGLVKDIRGNGDTIDFEQARELAGEVVMCADAAERCTDLYKAVDAKANTRKRKR